jgi:hypothetical protein
MVYRFMFNYFFLIGWVVLTALVVACSPEPDEP